VIDTFPFEPNTVHCAESVELLAEMPAGCVDLVLTDIPYNEVNRSSHGLRKLDKGTADSAVFDLPGALFQMLRVCSRSLYVFCCTEQVSEIRRAFVRAGLSTRHCIWEKTNPSPMNGQHLWLSSIENCVYAKRPRAVFNEHCKSSVWRFPVERNQLHPTQKSLKLFEYLVTVSSNPGDLVLDPFCGSGTSAVAAERLGRRYIAMDIDQDYCRLTLSRLRGAL